MHTAIHTDNAPAAIGPYSQAIVAGDTLYVSGQLPIDPAIAAKVDAGKVEAVSGELISGLVDGIVKEIG